MLNGGGFSVEDPKPFHILYFALPFSNKPNPNFYIILTTYDNNIKDDEKGYK